MVGGLIWPGLSLNWGRLHVSSLIYDWSNPQPTVMSAPRCLPHSRPSLARSFWLKHQPARELHLAPKPESRQGPRFEFWSFCSPRFRLPWPVWLLFRARPPWRRDLSPFRCVETSLILFPLVISRIEPGRQRGWRKGELRRTSLLGRLIPRLGLHNVEKTSSRFALYAYSFRDRKVFLYLAHLCRGKVIEVTGGSL